MSSVAGDFLQFGVCGGQRVYATLGLGLVEGDFFEDGRSSWICYRLS